ncbi:ATP-binding cassette domain-containing protein [Ketogulonicigenium robustum]|uniref:thiamine ABC transporter ATP-binding protein n=1 Tax=Ketogulonicigenium robustum TaxID=92947 RepID=UPI000A27000F|nr:ATP-binding cassette domain-containing protein [Ketogulonicigenium robustum]
MLRLDHIDIRQGDFHLGADFALPAGSFTAITGPSGGGKSTLLSVIAGFWPVTSGKLYWQGSDLTDLPPEQRPVSILFQDNNLFPHLTLRQNLTLALRPALRPSAAEAAQIEDALTRVGLAGLSARKPAQLSGGQQSRAALARLLLEARPIVLLDEPFAALGPAQRHDMLDLAAATLRSERQTMLMVTHDPQDAARVADHLVLVADGTAHAPRPVAEALADPHPALAAYLGD